MSPIYVYRCDSCADEFEIAQSYNDDALTVCSKCSGELHKVIQATPVVWKTAGSYTSDQHGLQGRKRKPNIKVGSVKDLPKEEQEKMLNND